jgi:hypothetical protein
MHDGFIFRCLHTDVIASCAFGMAGEDIANIKAGSLEVAIQVMHKHPTAVAFTYILPECDHKLAGTVFLKVKKPVSTLLAHFLDVLALILCSEPQDCVHRMRVLSSDIAHAVLGPLSECTSMRGSKESDVSYLFLTFPVSAVAVGGWPISDL